MIIELIEGPAWAPHRIDLRAGRFPLGVEAHLMQMTAHLVPGATTVTINARYYALHGYVALVAHDEGLDREHSLELLRRCEVVVAAATIANSRPDSLFAPHGNDFIEPLLQIGPIDLEVVSAPGAYSRNPAGFLNTYLGSELETGILADTSMSPGPRLDTLALHRGFDGLIELARGSQLAIDDVQGVASHLSMHAAATTTDGRWLAQLLCADGLDDIRVSDQTRRSTIRMLGRALDLRPSASAEDSVYAAIGYGDLVDTDPVLASIEEVEPWRGTLLRRHSVNAWRRMWAWLVDQIGEGLDAVDAHTAPSDLADLAAAQCPGGTVRSYLDGLPTPVDSAGDPVAAEDAVTAQHRSEFDRDLAILFIGGQRIDSLDGATRDAFVGQRRTILDPIWVHNRVDESLDRPLADFVRDLTSDVLDRSQRIAARRSQLRRDGTYVRPGRVHEHADKLWKTSNEGRGSVGLRLVQLARILTSVGVLEIVDDSLRLSEHGRGLLS